MCEELEAGVSDLMVSERPGRVSAGTVRVERLNMPPLMGGLKLVFLKYNNWTWCRKRTGSKSRTEDPDGLSDLVAGCVVRHG